MCLRQAGTAQVYVCFGGLNFLNSLNYWFAQELMVPVFIECLQLFKFELNYSSSVLGAEQIIPSIVKQLLSIQIS